MSGSGRMLLVGVPLSVLAWCGWQLSRLSAARESWENAAVTVGVVSSELAELERLEADSRQIEWGARPDADVLALARGAVQSAGLPARALQGVTPTGDRPVGGGGAGGVQIREQSVRISLQSMTAARVGSFLRAWQAASPRWTVTSIEMNTNGARGGGEYAVSLVVTAPYAEGVTP